MKTLAQIRAVRALQCQGGNFGGAQGGEVIKKLPALVKTDGLLATLAFCHEKGGGHQQAATILAQHLAYTGPDGSVGITSHDTVLGLMSELAAGDAALLRRATAEALALLNYMKRFAG